MIPFLSELADEWLFQELIERQVQAFAALDCTVAYLPAVVVDGSEFLVLVEPDGVEVAGYRLVECALALTVCLLKGAFHAAVRRVGVREDALSVVDYRGDKVALLIDVCHTLIVNHLARFGGECVPYNRQNLLNFCHLINFERSTAVTLDAAGSFASG